MQNKEQRVVFAAGTGQEGKPLIIMGIPKEAWEYMKDGKTHTFDFTNAGIPIQVVLFGGADHNSIMKSLGTSMKNNNTAYFDERNNDFSIKDKNNG